MKVQHCDVKLNEVYYDLNIIQKIIIKKNFKL